MRLPRTACLALLLLAISSAGAIAQSFTLSTAPRRQNFPGDYNPATFKVWVVPSGGFSATVSFSVQALTIPYVALQVSTDKINAPYTTELKIVVDRKSANIPGSHMIVIHGWNGSLHTYDTCYLDVPKTRGWEYYTASNSPLPSNTIRAIATDRTGAAWIATAKGLARFDGSNWNVYTHNDFGGTSDDVTSIAVDSGNAIWIGPTNGGIARFKDGAW